MEEQRNYENGYDGYYDDIRPLDEKMEREKVDKTLIRNVCILIGCVVIVIGGCVAMLCLL